MNQDAEIQQLTSELESGTVTTREPNYSSREVTTENGGFGSSYIEVDLSRQHMWVYQNGSVILESDVVSGKMTRDRYTPSGVFQLAYKEKDRDLKGEIDPSTGEPSYVSHVNNWMPFNGGIGFHDASWRSSFGGTIYINSGSHGCVNLPTSFAPKLYDVISKDMPIVVYYSQGCKFES
ncbi:MAG: L,D-transpeptidase [Lachnospiraceae bacterium]|nr:L,D-transpeptidase [Lachnospiraceae bacterium]